MLSKSDVGTCAYPAAGNPLPHAVMNVSGGSISSTFAYDANGNQTSGLGRSIVYTSYNKPASITQGTRTISFLDDSEHQQWPIPFRQSAGRARLVSWYNRISGQEMERCHGALRCVEW